MLEFAKINVEQQMQTGQWIRINLYCSARLVGERAVIKMFGASYYGGLRLGRVKTGVGKTTELRRHVASYLGSPSADHEADCLSVELLCTRALWTAIKRNGWQMNGEPMGDNHGYYVISIRLCVVINKSASDRVIRAAVNVAAVGALAVRLFVQLERRIGTDIFDVF